MILCTEPAAPGDWALIAVGQTILAAADRARTEDLATALAGPDGFRAALERLVSGGISAAPDFALLDASGGIVRLVLRGAAEVVAGAERISGVGVTTWTERVLEHAGELRLVVPGSSWRLVVGGAGAVAPMAPAASEEAAVPAAAGSSPAATSAAVGPATEPAAPAPPAAAPATLPVPQDPPPVREDAAPHATLAPPGDDAPAAAAADPEPYAFLFGDTIYRTVGGIDVRIPNPDPARPGDHDGRTVLVDELEAHEPAELPSAPAARGPVLALELPGGAVEPLTAPLLVGRSPSDPGHDASGGPPRLVRIAVDDKDISRTHARIEVAGGAVVVTDLDSKNGTSVTMPGSTPRKLRAGEPAVVLPDTLIDLGGGVTMTVRETVAEGVA